MAKNYIVIDSESAVKFAHRTGLPLTDLIERECMNCGQPVFLTRKQLVAYVQDPATPTPLVFACTECAQAKQQEGKDKPSK